MADPLSALSAVDIMLRNSVLDDQEAIAAGLRDGRLVVIRDAFKSSFADRVHSCLDAVDGWTLVDGGHGHHRYFHHGLYNPEAYPPDLAWAVSVFTSEATKAWIARLSGRDCSASAKASASWYLPGDYATAHSDHSATGGEKDRQVAFVWHLAKDWRTEWGGDFYWGPAQRSLSPSYNTLLLFNVVPDQSHSITPVSPYACSKRLAVNGWWRGAWDDMPPPAPQAEAPPIEVI